MAKFTSCVVGCVLLLVWNLRVSSGLPVRNASAENHAECAFVFRSLLLNVTRLLDDNVLCFGISPEKVAARDADTVQACAPTQTQKRTRMPEDFIVDLTEACVKSIRETLFQSPGCVSQRNSPFSESECLGSIMKDLAHYESVIQSYLKLELRRPEEEVALLSPTLGIISSLRKSCSPKPSEEDNSSVTPEGNTAQVWDDDFFSNRYEMCKMMRGFHIRIITINRAMGYISSGDHRK